MPDDPGGLVEGVGVFAEFREVVPEGDVTVLPQFSTAAHIAQSTAHTEAVDKVSVSCNQAVESVI